VAYGAVTLAAHANATSNSSAENAEKTARSTVQENIAKAVEKVQKTTRRQQTIPGRDGQFLTADERLQSIDLFTFDLSLFEFSPSEFKARNPADSAQRSVLDYFRT
jgi:hypothetical protein